MSSTVTISNTSDATVCIVIVHEPIHSVERFINREFCTRKRRRNVGWASSWRTWYYPRRRKPWRKYPIERWLARPLETVRVMSLAATVSRRPIGDDADRRAAIGRRVRALAKTRDRCLV